MSSETPFYKTSVAGNELFLLSENLSKYFQNTEIGQTDWQCSFFLVPRSGI